MRGIKLTKGTRVLLIISIWIVTTVILYILGLLTTDIDKINEMIGNNPMKMRVIFVLLSSLRAIFFIPQTIFILIGGVLFGVCEGFVLSLIALIIGQSIMYVVGKYFGEWFLGEKFLEKNINLIAYIRKYGYKFLALGIACPVIPSDTITLLSGGIKLDYKKSIITIILASTPIMFLYGLIGNGVTKSFVFSALLITSITLISYYIFILWNKIKA